MAGVMGLEPTIFAVTGRRINQLCYTPAFQATLISKDYSSHRIKSTTQVTWAIRSRATFAWNIPRHGLSASGLK